MLCSDVMYQVMPLLLTFLVFSFAFDHATGSRIKYTHKSSAVDSIGVRDDQEQLTSWPDTRITTTSQGDHLKVCDCEFAPISNHGGLLCDKEGYFIASFEAVGHWINGGGRVPLSRAKCCRLCVSEPLSPSAQKALPAEAEPWGVISVGCHASTSKSKVACEDAPTTTFATGFQRDVLVPSLAAATYYPEGPMTCCSPALMLSNGDAWEIERCACEWSSTTGCTSMGDDYLLWGFAVFRDGGSGSHVPIAPAQCCQACLGSKIYSMDQCLALNRCSRRGICVLGACSCDDGWGGPDCSQQLKHKTWPPKWLLYSMMIGSVIVSVTLLLASRHVLSEYMERRRVASEENQAMLDPLLVAEGEIGDEDTTDEEGDDGDRTPAVAVRDSVHMPLLATESADDPGTVSDGEADAEAAAGGAGGDAAAADAAGAGADSAAEDVDEKAELAAPGMAEEDAARAAEVKFDEKRSPLSLVKCSICFDRPVQVALVPCGHSNLCRHCARRLEHCPYCRKPVVRRQRLYLADG
eukprot:jgi/Ulvmu1/10893/UM007_0070.1